MVEKEKTSIYLLAIVGIVAVVGIVILIVNSTANTGIYVSITDIRILMIEETSSPYCTVTLNPEEMVWITEDYEATLTENEHDHTIQLTAVSDDYKTCSFIIDGEVYSLDVGSASELGYTDLNPYGIGLIIIHDAKSSYLEGEYKDKCLVGIGTEAGAIMQEGESYTFSLEDGDHTVEIISVSSSD